MKTRHLLWFTCLLCGTVSSAMDYYVNDADTSGDVYCSTFGNDFYSGTNPAAPKLTIQSLFNEYTIQGDDTIWVDTGYYQLPATLEITTEDDGIPGSPVVIQGSTNNAAGGTFIDRNETGWGSVYALYLNDADYYTLRNLRVTGGDIGIQMERAVGISIDGCEVFSNAYYGLQASLQSDVDVSHSRIHHNTAMECYVVYLSTMSVNQCTLWGSGNSLVYLAGGAGMSVSNSILYATKKLYELSGAYSGDYNVLYSTNKIGILFGTEALSLNAWQHVSAQDNHSLCLDPDFVESEAGDFHLRSTAGTWSNDVWVIYDSESPCIDQGDPVVDYSNEPMPNGGRLNIGAYADTFEASKSGTGVVLQVNSPGVDDILAGTIRLSWVARNLDSENVLIQWSSDNGIVWSNIGSAIAATNQWFEWDSSANANTREGWWRVVRETDTNVFSLGGPFILHNDPFYFYVNDTNTSGDIYTSVAGSSTNSGLSPSAPKGAVQDIIEEYDLLPGDIVLIDTGYYMLTNNISLGSGGLRHHKSTYRVSGKYQ